MVGVSHWNFLRTPEPDKSWTLDEMLGKVSRQMNYRTYHADAFAWLKERDENSIHAIVTDPPYGLKEFTSKVVNLYWLNISHDNQRLELLRIYRHAFPVENPSRRIIEFRYAIYPRVEPNTKPTQCRPPTLPLSILQGHRRFH